MKTCPKCKIEKSIEEFSKNGYRKDGLQRICKVCVSEQDRRLYQRDKNKILQRNQRWGKKVKEWYIKHKQGSKCEICDEKRYWCLEWHHIESEEKENNISNMIHRGYSIENIKKEIEKCVCVCANCHRDIHYQEKLKKLQ